MKQPVYKINIRIAGSVCRFFMFVIKKSLYLHLFKKKEIINVLF
jgi:hypothetical protein